MSLPALTQPIMIRARESEMDRMLAATMLLVTLDELRVRLRRRRYAIANEMAALLTSGRFPRLGLSWFSEILENVHRSDQSSQAISHQCSHRNHTSYLSPVHNS